MDLSDSEIKKALECETTEEEKIKAIYPHISASVVDGKPYYCIRWYDIKNKDFNTGYGSFNLEYVCEWYEKYFEEIKYDFVDEINRLQAEKATFESRNKALRTERNRLNKEITKQKLKNNMLYEETQAEIEKLQKFKAYFDFYYGCDIEILGIDENGNTTSFDEFYNCAIANAESIEHHIAHIIKTAKAESYKEFFNLVHSEFKNISDYQYGKLNMTFCSNFQVAIDKLREIYRKLEGGTSV